MDAVRLLVIDDFADNLAIAQKYLEGAGAAVAVARSGEEGLKACLNRDFDLVFLDLQMPEVDGYTVLQQLQEQGFTTPVIALTAHATFEERQRSLKAGFAEHITNPIDRDKLIGTARNLLKIDEPEQPMRADAKL